MSTVKIKTTRFGDLEVSPTTFLDIIGGLVGFPKDVRFILLDYTPPFSWLQAVDNAELAFVVVNAAEFGDGYVFDLPTKDAELDLQEGDDIAVFNLVSIRPNANDSTVNLKAPVVVNLRTRKGRQIILEDMRYPTRMPLWQEGGSEGEANKEESPK